MIESLYVHIPFCRKFCPYCDYPKTLYETDLVAAYVRSLFVDLESLQIEKSSLKTIYIGGGTPNCLPISYMEELLIALQPLLRRSRKYEWTIEMNPELITEEYLCLLKKYGVNRISLGAQTFNDVQLKLLGRLTTREQLISKVELVKKHFDNFSVDLIYGLPKDGLDVLKDNIDILVVMNTPHVSIYPLTIHEDTPYYRMGITEQSEDDYVLFTETINSLMRSAGYSHYEITNYAKKAKFQGLHNSTYWAAKEYYASGAGAHAYINGTRFRKTVIVNDYIEAPLERFDVSRLDQDEVIEETIFLGLRLKTGISFREFTNTFGVCFPIEIIDKIKNTENSHFFRLSDDKVAVKEKYFVILDYILRKIGR